MVAAGGNHLNGNMSWPANETDKVIGVVGTDATGDLWQRDSCPIPGTTGECGSNFDSVNSKIAAPSEDILTHHISGDYNAPVGCSDNNFGASDDGYQRCSGTSFAAPLVSSVAAMIRSLNPLISFDDVKQVLIDAKVAGLNDQRYSIPRADESVKITLGKSNNKQVVNRLTPMFRMVTAPHVNYQGYLSYLSTSIPQVAVASRFGTYLVNPRTDTGEYHYSDGVNYIEDSTSPNVSGYMNFKYEGQVNAATHAPFFVFGGHRNPFSSSLGSMVPLHHMARPKVYSPCKKLADHAYATTKDNGFFASTNFCSTGYNAGYLYEGIEGYILKNCPNGVDCYENTNNESHAQCLKLRYSPTNKSFALMMASEVNKTIFSSYGTNYLNESGNLEPITNLAGMSNAECLGYVFPNVDSDSDGVIDGMELVLGTNPNDSDSDNDNLTDGEEYPLAGIPQSDPLICNAKNCFRN